MHINVLSGNLKGRAHLEDLGIDGGNIKMDNVNWIHLAQNRDQYLVLVSTVMNLLLPLKAIYFFSI
jgi:hypothetical protein